MIYNHVLPLRLILNSNCNGHCSYCHHEGTHTNIDMPLEIILQCANVAQQLLAPISLTGGEPSLRNDLIKIINTIHNIEPKIKISLTSNGYKLINSCDIAHPIDTLNLSITSLKNHVASRYQNVDPTVALKALKMFPAIHKNLNVVIVEDNYLELNEIIEYCTINKYDLDIMFELKEYTYREKQIQQYVFNMLEKLGDITIVLKPSPVIHIITRNKCNIKIKHPYLSALPSFEICKNCLKNKNCFERICSIRIYPDGHVSPCLNQFIKSGEVTIAENIKSIYTKINADISFLSFITNSQKCNSLNLSALNTFKN